MTYTTANEFNDPFDSSFSYSIDTIYKTLITDHSFLVDLAKVQLYKLLFRKPSQEEIDEYLHNIDSDKYRDNMLMLFDSYCREVLAFVRSEYLICCFSKTFDNQALWAYYADSGKGIVIEYESQYIEFYATRFSKRIGYSGNLCNTLSEVEYVLTINEKDSSMISLLKSYFSFSSNNLGKKDTKFRYELSDEDFRDIFFKKIDKWSIENEYRIIIANNDLNQKRKNIRITKIQSIYMGTNICDWHKEVLKLFCKKNNIKLFRMEKSYSSSKLGLVAIEEEL